MEGTFRKPSADDLFESLADVHRRRLLLALLEREQHGDSSVVLSGHGGDAAGFDYPEAMIHVHLPKLAEFGLISWEKDTNVVGTGPAFEEIRPLLELLDRHEAALSDDWQ